MAAQNPMLIDLALREGINLGCRGDSCRPSAPYYLIGRNGKGGYRAIGSTAQVIPPGAKGVLTIVGLLSYFSCELACAVFPIFGIFNCMEIG